MPQGPEPVNCQPLTCILASCKSSGWLHQHCHALMVHRGLRTEQASHTGSSDNMVYLLHDNPHSDQKMGYRLCQALMMLHVLLFHCSVTSLPYKLSWQVVSLCG